MDQEINVCNWLPFDFKVDEVVVDQLVRKNPITGDLQPVGSAALIFRGGDIRGGVSVILMMHYDKTTGNYTVVNYEEIRNPEVILAEVMRHSAWESWMRNWVFVKEGYIYGYAPDNSCLTKCKDVDQFFTEYELASKKWVSHYE